MSPDLKEAIRTASTREGLKKIQKLRNKNPEALPIYILLFAKKGKCCYCDNASKIRGMVGLRTHINTKPRLFITGAACIECINAFLPEHTKLVVAKTITMKKKV